MRFLHTADLQLGERFVRFGEQADKLRRGRVKTLEHILVFASERDVDAVLIAGDLFEDNQVDPSVVNEAFSIFSQNPDVPVYVLPGNHDTITGPASVWERPPFDDPPPHVTILRRPEPIWLDGKVVLLPRPLTQKKYRHDPCREIREMAQDIDDNVIRIGITHGSPAIEGKHQLDDYPIALDAADQANLNYLAIGHWHSWGSYNDGRMIMPGTPEPDNFKTGDSGYVALVAIPDSDSTPQVQQIPVNTFTWSETTFDVTAKDNETKDSLLQRLGRELDRMSDDPQNTVVRLQLTGTPSQDLQKDEFTAIHALLEPYAAKLLDDQTFAAISTAELEAIKARSPVIAKTLVSLMNVQQYFNPREKVPIPEDISVMNPPDFEQLLAEQFDDVESLQDIDESFVKAARKLLIKQLGEVRR